MRTVSGIFTPFGVAFVHGDLRRLRRAKGLFDGQLSRTADAMFEAIGGILRIFFSGGPQLSLLCGIQSPDDPGGRAQHERPWRNLCALGDQRIGANQTPVTDHCAVQDGGSHSDQHFVANRAGVNNRRMTDRHVVPHQARTLVCQVQHGIVLDVRVVPDNDAIDVAPQDCVIPNAGMIAESNVADNHRAARNINVAADGRLSPQKRFQLPRHFRHGNRLIQERKQLPIKKPAGTFVLAGLISVPPPQRGVPEFWSRSRRLGHERAKSFTGRTCGAADDAIHRRTRR